MNMESTLSTTLRYVRCHIGQESYGLNMNWVRNIQRTDRLRYNPEAQSVLLENEKSWRKTVPVAWLPVSEGEIPVYSLGQQLQRTFTFLPEATRRVIVLHTPASAHGQARPWALLVDSVSRVEQISSNRMAALPPIAATTESNYFSGVLRLGEEIILFLSPEQLYPWRESPSGSISRLEKSSQSASLLKPPAPASITAVLQNEKKADRRNQIIIFSTSDIHVHDRPLSFALSVTQAPEILAPMPLTPVPGAPIFVLGLVNWREQPIPVIDLNARLGLPSSTTPVTTERLVIARDNVQNTSLFAGFLTRSAMRIIYLPVANQPYTHPLPIGISFTKGVFEMGNEIVVIPDIQSILSHN